MAGNQDAIGAGATGNDDLLGRLGGSERILAVEAPAGCGKTHTAIQLAGRVAATQLAVWERVLFLSHTNSARNEIGSRLGSLSAQVVTRTLDGFAAEIVGPWAQVLKLPDPVRPPSREVGSEWFDRVRVLAVRLVGKQAIASAIVARFPLIIADEHQDAARTQHALLAGLASRSEG